MKKFAAFSLFLSGVLFLCGCTGRYINLNDYIDVTFEGYDGYASAIISYDEEGLLKVSRNIKVNKSAIRQELKKEQKESGEDVLSDEEIEEIIEETEPYDYLLNLLDDAVILKSESLSSGEETELTWNVKDEDIEEIEKYFKITVKYSDETYEVPILEEGTAYDPFNDLEVTFSGVSGSGQISVINNSPYKSALGFSCSKTNSLSNGDVVTITVTFDDGLSENFGVFLTKTQSDYTVSGLEEEEENE